jgi:hypothetical protein
MIRRALFNSLTVAARTKRIVSARALARIMSSDAPAETLFEKIAAKKIPSTAVYEDELVYAFRDINPVVRGDIA